MPNASTVAYRLQTAISQGMSVAKQVVVEKEKFDSLLGKLLKAKPEPRKKIKTQGKRGPKSPILSR